MADLTTREAADLVEEEIGRHVDERDRTRATVKTAVGLSGLGGYDVTAELFRRMGYDEPDVYVHINNVAEIRGNDPALVFSQVWGIPALTGEV